MNRIKGLDLLVKGFNDYLKNYNDDNVKLAIIGPDNGFEEEIEKLIDKFNINDKVILTGPLYRKISLKPL